MKNYRLILSIVFMVITLALLLSNSAQAGQGGPTVYYQGGYYYGYTSDVVVEKPCYKCRPCRCDCCYSCCCRPCPPPRVYYRPHPRYYPYHPGVYAPVNGWYMNFGFGGRL